MPNRQKYVFAEIEDYRELLETKHLRSKNLFVITISAILGVAVLTYMIVAKYPLQTTLSLMAGFLLLMLVNVACLAFGYENHYFYQLNQYVTSFGIFCLAIAMIFIFKSPSMVASLFIAYAIAAFYQDLKVMFISNTFLLFSAIMIMAEFPEYLDFINASQESDFAVPFFFLVFILVLSISSYIIVKQKRFFYNQIALSKETEFRNIDLLIDLETQVTGRTISLSKYYDNILAFTDAFTNKIQMDNIFVEKIHIMQDLENNTPYPTMHEKYPNYSKEEFDRLDDLLLGNHRKLLKLAMKINYAKDIKIKKREIFSETQFKSFNHQSDSLEIKILAFAVFYTALRRGNAAMRPLTEEEIYNVLVYTDYYYYIDPSIIRIYQENNQVFDDIVTDILGKPVK
ncbi:MAG: hypothetical protein WC479_04985 [Candidatus Izemoplasmatales bacterium]|jgi:hypothetical protein|nr:hypothetical protein [Candidatus Izemoplasmatales bacterium]MDD3865744.1 hypothetical protein [Candidatus Izemoplasmatales bacterium]